MRLFDFLRSLRQTGREATTARLEVVEDRVHALSVSAARETVETHLATGRTFRVERRAPTADELAALAVVPADVRALFEPYAVVDLGGARLERAVVGPWARGPSGVFVRIGTDLEHADVVVRCDDGAAYVVEDDGAHGPTFEERHPSLWHYLLVVEALARPDATPGAVPPAV